jgi:hypothetical protein
MVRHSALSCSPNIVDALFRGSDRGSKSPTLNVSPTEVPILSPSPIVTRSRKTKDTKMPIRTVRRCAAREGTSGLDEWIGAGGMPERDLVG